MLCVCPEEFYCPISYCKACVEIAELNDHSLASEWSPVKFVKALVGKSQLLWTDTVCLVTALIEYFLCSAITLRSCSSAVFIPSTNSSGVEHFRFSLPAYTLPAFRTLAWPPDQLLQPCCHKLLLSCSPAGRICFLTAHQMVAVSTTCFGIILMLSPPRSPAGSTYIIWSQHCTALSFSFFLSAVGF